MRRTTGGVSKLDRNVGGAQRSGYARFAWSKSILHRHRLSVLNSVFFGQSIKRSRTLSRTIYSHSRIIFKLKNYAIVFSYVSETFVLPILIIIVFLFR